MHPERQHLDQLRMMTKVAHMYHTRGMVQTDIARALGLSQARVSRLLSAADDADIVRTIVVTPPGLNADLEDQLEESFGLLEAHIVDASGESETQLIETLGHAMAPIFQIMPIDGKIIGFNSWSRSMRVMVSRLSRFPRIAAESVVELLGGVGQPAVQHEAAVATERLSQLTDSEALFLRVPGVVSDAQIREALLENDPHARRAIQAMDDLDIALAGIGNCTIVPPLVGGDNFFTEAQFERARKLGAVGEINLRFMDRNGVPIQSELDDLVVGITLEQLRSTDRRIGVAGGASKHEAILAAVRGGWINVLVTDEDTAKYLIEHGPAAM